MPRLVDRRGGDEHGERAQASEKDDGRGGEQSAAPYMYLPYSQSVGKNAARTSSGPTRPPSAPPSVSAISRRSTLS